ncbi:flagellar filament capping protein FliD [bacterium]|nr:flagellar filament capping protein FliD [bacterium]
MGTISSGVGLVSGLNIKDLVTKLLDLEKTANKQIQDQVDTSGKIRDAYQTLSLRLVGLNLTASKLGRGGALTDRTATSSSDAITATAGKGAPVGSYQYTPRQLVSTNQLLSTGFKTDTTSITNSATTIKISQGGFVDESTELAALNGGAGVRVGSIRVTDSAGGSSVVDLTGSVTVRDVVDSINGSAGANVRAQVKGDRLELVDNAGGSGTLQVLDLAGGKAATDLGINSLTRNANTYTGQDVYSLGSNLSLARLRDGNGVRENVGNDFSVTVGPVSFDVDISGARTVGDIVNAINQNAGNTGGRVVASINDNRLQITDSQGTSSVVVAPIGGSKTAGDLGLLNGSGGAGTLTGDNVLGSLDTVLLRTLKGGSAATSPTSGTVAINGTNIDLSTANTLQDVIDGINAVSGTTGTTASINKAANGIQLRTTGPGGLNVSDVSGNLATFLGIAGNTTGSAITRNGGDLDRQYVNENTRLSSYGSATGVPKGKFRITDGTGNSAVVDLTQDTDDTIGDVIRELNTRGLAISARINNTGDGILIEKTAGTQALQVTEVDNGTTARALGLLATPNGSGNIDGTLEKSIAIAAGTTLAGLSTKIREAQASVQASVINDGSSQDPFRLSLTSNRSGRSGRILFDAGQSSLSLDTVSTARDAVLIYGSTGPGVTPVQVISSSNTFSGLVPGVSVTAKQVSNTPVTVTVAGNQQSVIDAVKSFVDGYNEIRKYIKENDSYDANNDERGLLFTDQTTRLVEGQLSRFVTNRFSGTGSTFSSLGQIGIKLDQDSNLELDSSKLQSVLSQSPADVEKFLTTANTGIAAQFQKLTDNLTNTGSGILSNRATQLQLSIDRQNIALDFQNKRLTSKEDRLYKQFYAMEEALSAFQSQQTALTRLASIATSFGK